MVGFYMDAPAPRIAWDRDGSLLTTSIVDGTLTNHTAATRRAINAESGETLLNYFRIAVIFPVPMDMAAIFAATGETSSYSVETSKDTTNGLDGTWETHITGWNTGQPIKPNYRMSDQVKPFVPGTPSLGVRGVRLSRPSTAGNVNVRALHLYGSPSGTATTDRLALWHPTLDTALPPAWFDWGDVPRGTSAERSFRIKNLSDALTASNIGVYFEALTPGVPSVDGMHSLSDTGGASFLSGLDVVSLAPGALTPVIVLRRVVPTNAQVSVWSARLVADVSEWSGA